MISSQTDWSSLFDEDEMQPEYQYLIVEEKESCMISPVILKEWLLTTEKAYWHPRSRSELMHSQYLHNKLQKTPETETERTKNGALKYPWIKVEYNQILRQGNCLRHLHMARKLLSESEDSECMTMQQASSQVKITKSTKKGKAELPISQNLVTSEELKKNLVGALAKPDSRENSKVLSISRRPQLHKRKTGSNVDGEVGNIDPVLRTPQIKLAPMTTVVSSDLNALREKRSVLLEGSPALFADEEIESFVNNNSVAKVNGSSEIDSVTTQVDDARLTLLPTDGNTPHLDIVNSIGDTQNFDSAHAGLSFEDSLGNASNGTNNSSVLHRSSDIADIFANASSSMPHAPKIRRFNTINSDVSSHQEEGFETALAISDVRAMPAWARALIDKNNALTKEMELMRTQINVLPLISRQVSDTGAMVRLIKDTLDQTYNTSTAGSANKYTLILDHLPITTEADLDAVEEKLKTDSIFRQQFNVWLKQMEHLNKGVKNVTICVQRTMKALMHENVTVFGNWTGMKKVYNGEHQCQEIVQCRAFKEMEIFTILISYFGSDHDIKEWIRNTNGTRIRYHQEGSKCRKVAQTRSPCVSLKKVANTNPRKLASPRKLGTHSTSGNEWHTEDITLPSVHNNKNVTDVSMAHIVAEDNNVVGSERSPGKSAYTWYNQ